MKRRIIQGLNGLINAEDLEERINLQIKVSHLIQHADFGMEEEREEVEKTRIISSLKDYIDSCSEEQLYKQIISAHIAFIESRNVA